MLITVKFYFCINNIQVHICKRGGMPVFTYIQLVYEQEKNLE